jgi:hypothetical protein
VKKVVVAQPFTSNKTKTFFGGNMLYDTNAHGSFFNLIVGRSVDTAFTVRNPLGSASRK